MGILNVAGFLTFLAATLADLASPSLASLLFGYFQLFLPLPRLFLLLNYSAPTTVATCFSMMMLSGPSEMVFLFYYLFVVP
jgi:hypothetical protein